MAYYDVDWNGDENENIGIWVNFLIEILSRVSTIIQSLDLTLVSC